MPKCLYMAHGLSRSSPRGKVQRGPQGLPLVQAPGSPAQGLALPSAYPASSPLLWFDVLCPHPRNLTTLFCSTHFYSPSLLPPHRPLQMLPLLWKIFPCSSGKCYLTLFYFSIELQFQLLIDRDLSLMSEPWRAGIKFNSYLSLRSRERDVPRHHWIPAFCIFSCHMLPTSWSVIYLMWSGSSHHVSDFSFNALPFAYICETKLSGVGRTAHKMACICRLLAEALRTPPSPGRTFSVGPGSPWARRGHSLESQMPLELSLMSWVLLLDLLPASRNCHRGKPKLKGRVGSHLTITILPNICGLGWVVMDFICVVSIVAVSFLLFEMNNYGRMLSFWSCNSYVLMSNIF